MFCFSPCLILVFQVFFVLLGLFYFSLFLRFLVFCKSVCLEWFVNVFDLQGFGGIWSFFWLIWYLVNVWKFCFFFLISTTRIGKKNLVQQNFSQLLSVTVSTNCILNMDSSESIKKWCYSNHTPLSCENCINKKNVHSIALTRRGYHLRKECIPLKWHETITC